MFVRVYRGIVIAAAAVLLAACATQPVQTVSQVPIVTNKANPSIDDIRQAIVRAATGLGWQVKTDRPGHMLGTLTLRTHVAVVDIDYDTKAYSIKYKDSTNLFYDGSSIHKNYNGWIQNLDRQIKAQLSTL